MFRLMNLLKNIKPLLLLAWLAGWNAMLGTGIYLNGVMGKITKPGAQIFFPAFFAVALLITSALCAASIFSQRFQKVILQKEGSISAIRGELWFIMILTLGLGIASLAGAWLV